MLLTPSSWAPGVHPHRGPGPGLSTYYSPAARDSSGPLQMLPPMQELPACVSPPGGVHTVPDVWKEDLDGRSPGAPLPTQGKHCTLLVARGGRKLPPSHSAWDRGGGGTGGRWPDCPVLSSSGLCRPRALQFSHLLQHLLQSETNATFLTPPVSSLLSFSLSRGLRIPVICYQLRDSFMPGRGAQLGETP